MANRKPKVYKNITFASSMSQHTEKSSNKKSFSKYVSFEKIQYLLREMNKYPMSYLLYALPSLMLILMITELVNFIEFVSVGYLQLSDPNLVITEFFTILGLVALFLVLYYIFDTMVAHFSYTQFKNKLSLTDTFKVAYKRYHIYLIHRILQLVFVAIPLIIGVIVLFGLSYVIALGFEANINSFVILALLFLVLITLAISFAMSAYMSFKYTYLSVSTHFHNSNKLFQVDLYHTKIRGHFKSVIIRVLVLLGFVLLLQFIQHFYEYLTSFVATEILVLGFQIIGVLISMFVFYFINAYLFHTYMEEFESSQKSKLSSSLDVHSKRKALR